jgi:hypothetical protein
LACDSLRGRLLVFISLWISSKEFQDFFKISSPKIHPHSVPSR